MYVCSIPNGSRDIAISMYDLCVAQFGFGFQRCHAFPPYCATVWSTDHVVPLLLLNTFSGFLCGEFRIVERLALRECGTLPTVHVSSQKARQENVLEQENILEMVQRNSTTTSTRRFLHFSVLHEHVYGFYAFHLQRLQNLHWRDSATLLEFYHWLHTNRQLHPLTLITDEATFTRNGINKV
jgi:hypothetical protein